MFFLFKRNKNKNIYIKIQEIDTLLKKFPKRIPVIVQPIQNIYKLKKTKFLVPKDFTMGNFYYILKQRIKLKNTESLLLYHNNNLVSLTKKINEYLNPSGYIIIQFGIENTFG